MLPQVIHRVMRVCVCFALFTLDHAIDDDYSSENENNPYRSDERTNSNLNPILPYLGLPEYDYVDAQSYDDLLPQHLTYGKDQTVKLHNAKLMSCETIDVCRCCSSSVLVHSTCDELIEHPAVVHSSERALHHCGHLARGEIVADTTGRNRGHCVERCRQ